MDHLPEIPKNSLGQVHSPAMQEFFAFSFIQKLYEGRQFLISKSLQSSEQLDLSQTTTKRSGDVAASCLRCYLVDRAPLFKQLPNAKGGL